MGTVPLVNGNRYSWASIEIALVGATIGTQIFVDCEGANYGEKLTVSFMRGTSRSPIGWTSGIWEPDDLVLDFGKSSATELITQLGPGWLGTVIIANVCYADAGEPVTVDSIVAKFTGRANAHSQSPDPLKEPLTLKPILIALNGIPSMLNFSFPGI
jgi:hypothetical protein